MSMPDYPRQTGVLSRREREVVQALADGLAPKQIAHRLGLIPATARNHVTNARLRLGARSREHLIAQAIRSGQIA